MKLWTGNGLGKCLSSSTAALFYLSLSIVLFSSACQKDEDRSLGCTASADYRSIEVVTGIQLRDTQGQDLVRLGNPNERRGESYVYPIPSEVAATVYSPGGIQRIWIVPGHQDRSYDDELNIDSLLLNHQYDTLAISSNAVFQGASLDNTQEFYLLSTSDLEVGFHRVFLEDSVGQVLSHNIYKVADYDAVGPDYSAFIESIWPD